MCHHHITSQKNVMLIKYPNSPAPTSHSCHTDKDLKLKLENNPATSVWRLTITMGGETELWRESTVRGILQILQSHQAMGKSLAAPPMIPCVPTELLGSPALHFCPGSQGLALAPL